MQKFKEAKQMAMDIRDISLNIGAYNLYKIVANMENLFVKDSVENWEELVDEYEVALKRLFEEIDSYLKILK